MSVWEGAVAMRREAFAYADGWPAPFWYAHEGIELAWRVWDAGRTVWYAGDLAVHHPRTTPTRHADYLRLNARNRVWLARRNLPWPLAFLYLTNWVVLTLIRERRSGVAIKAWFSGFFEGLRNPAGERRPMAWRTAWRMVKLGRPPIV
jgi:GT2 family glycosyltransferase